MYISMHAKTKFRTENINVSSCTEIALFLRQNTMIISFFSILITHLLRLTKSKATEKNKTKKKKGRDDRFCNLIPLFANNRNSAVFFVRALFLSVREKNDLSAQRGR